MGGVNPEDYDGAPPPHFENLTLARASELPQPAKEAHFLRMFGQSDRQIADTDSPNDRWGTEPVLLVADKTGDYRVDVRAPNSKVAPGRYEIRLVSLRKSTPADKSLVGAQRIFEEAEHLGQQQNATAKRGRQRRRVRTLTSAAYLLRPS